MFGGFISQSLFFHAIREYEKKTNNSIFPTKCVSGFYFLFFSILRQSLVQRIRMESSSIANNIRLCSSTPFITRFLRTTRFKSHKIVSDFRLKFWEHFPFSYPLLFNLFRWRCLRIPSLGSHSTKFLHVYVYILDESDVRIIERKKNRH